MTPVTDRLPPGLSRFRRPAILTLLAAIGASSPLPSQTTSSWVGDYRLEGNPVALAIDVHGSKAAISRPPFLPRPDSVPISIRAGQVRFTIKSGGEPLLFEGTSRNGMVSGTVQQAGRSGTFRLLRVVDLGLARLQSYAGLYRTEEGRIFSVRRFSEFGTRLVLTDFETYRVAPLYPRGPGDFVGGAALFAPVTPAPFTVRFPRPGRMAFTDSAGGRVDATKVPLSETSFEVVNGSTRIAGTVTVPPGRGPHPAVLMVHGSGPADRNWGPYADFFLGRGIAVVGWDKRGVGRSGGDWTHATFEDLAGDALAVLARARQDRRLDSLRVGLWGISQAGWIEPLVARQARVAFVVVHAGPGVTVAEQGTQSLAYEVEAGGASVAEVALMLRYRELDDEFTRHGVGWDSLQATYRRLQDRPWIWPPAPADHWFRRFYRGIMDFDPVPAWQGVKAPVIAFLGERDLVVFPKENRPRLEDAFRRAALADAEIVIVPRANHLFMEAQVGSREEYPRLDRFIPDYFVRLGQWLDRRIGPTKD